MYTIMVLKTLGYGDDNPVMRKVTKDFLGLESYDTEKDEFRVQPCLSPIWDSAITAFALVQSGVPADDPRVQKCGEWIMSKEVTDFRGDWKHKNPTPVTSGWAFEFNNKFYPDVDDTYKVLLALGAIKMPDEEAKEEGDGARVGMGGELPVQERRLRGLRQGRDEAVAAGCAVRRPQRDPRPPCSDITSRALEVFGRMGVSRKESFVRRSIRFVRETQLPDGSWEGRWGVKYIYGTWLVLRGLRAIGEDMNQDWILRGVNWLTSCQNADGGWG